MLPCRKDLFVDCDRTLIDDGARPIAATADCVRALAAVDWSVVVWSRRGGDYARAVVERCGLVDLPRLVAIGKPSLAFDDKHWRWVEAVPCLQVPTLDQIVSITNAQPKRKA